MFDSLAIRPTAPFRKHIDIGEIAEALLFYGSVDLVLGEAELSELVRNVGLDTTLALVEDKHLRIMLLREGAATHAAGPPGRETYDFITWQRARTNGQLPDPQEVVRDAFYRVTQRRGHSRRAAQRFLRVASVCGLSDLAPRRSPVCDLSRQDARDPRYLQWAVAEAVTAMTGELPKPGWRFEVERVREGFGVRTNLDFKTLTAGVQARSGTAVDVTPALLLDCIHQARVDLEIAAAIGSELLTSELSSRLIEHRLRAALQAGPGAAPVNRLRDIALFQTVVLQGHRLGDAVRSGHKKLEAVFELVERARRFRSWLAERPADSSLLTEYYAAVTRESWVERLPGKPLRFAMFTALGLVVDAVAPTGVGTAIGVALGAADTFLVDRLVKGWNPGQFVDRELIPFVDRK